jgi:hypothetical protein
MYSSRAQFEQTKQWRGINYALGVPASLLDLAAISGVAALASAAGPGDRQLERAVNDLFQGR